MIFSYILLLSIESVVMLPLIPYSYFSFLLFLSSLARGFSVLLIFKKKLASGVVDFSLFFWLQSIPLYECLVSHSPIVDILHKNNLNGNCVTNLYDENDKTLRI